MPVIPKWAKYGVLAMIVANAAGVALVNHRLNQPPADNLTFYDDAAVAVNVPNRCCLA